MKIPRVKAPFTDQQVKALNNAQTETLHHPFTCCSPEQIEGCRKKKGGNGDLIATNSGWICPCGEYTQDWAYDFMVQ